MCRRENYIPVHLVHTCIRDLSCHLTYTSANRSCSCCFYAVSVSARVGYVCTAVYYVVYSFFNRLCVPCRTACSLCICFIHCLNVIIMAGIRHRSSKVMHLSLGLFIIPLDQSLHIRTLIKWCWFKTCLFIHCIIPFYSLYTCFFHGSCDCINSYLCCLCDLFLYRLQDIACILQYIHLPLVNRSKKVIFPTS